MPDPLVSRMREVELFAELDDDQLRWLVDAGEPVSLGDGEMLFEDGQQAEHFYVLLSGELLFTKRLNGRVEVVARHLAEPPPGAAGEEHGKPSAAHRFTGELPMLAGGGYVARGTAVGRTELLAYARPVFQEMIARCPQVCRVLLPVLAWRIRSYEMRAGQRAMLEGLGTLAAGLAHELNNPTSAVLRAAAELRASVRELVAAAALWGQAGTVAETAALDRMILQAPREATAARDPIEAADALDELADLLTGWQVPDAEDLAGMLVDAGLRATQLGGFAGQLQAGTLPAAVRSLAYVLRVDGLVTELTTAGNRISVLVRDTMAYANLDRAPVRSIELTEGLENTLALLAARLEGVEVCRSYLPGLPRVTGYPNELNQVWTNLIDNAIGAMEGRGVLRLSTRLEDGCAVVEVRDEGCGMPADVVRGLFQPFYTTKTIGQGVGLGLHLSHYVITVRHHGSIGVRSRPGDTRFTVRLPVDAR